MFRLITFDLKQELPISNSQLRHVRNSMNKDCTAAEGFLHSMEPTLWQWCRKIPWMFFPMVCRDTVERRHWCHPPGSQRPLHCLRHCVSCFFSSKSASAILVHSLHPTVRSLLYCEHPTVCAYVPYIRQVCEETELRLVRARAPLMLRAALAIHIFKQCWLCLSSVKSWKSGRIYIFYSYRI